MKISIYSIIILIVSFTGCSENPSDSNKDPILSESKTILNDFVFYRDSIFNTDTLSISLESLDPDVYIFINFYLGQRNINSFSYTILQIDSPAISSANFVVRPDYIEILWTTSYEINNMGWEIQRKDSNETYNVVGFVNGYGTSTETHSYSFKHYSNPSKLFFID